MARMNVGTDWTAIRLRKRIGLEYSSVLRLVYNLSGSEVGRGTTYSLYAGRLVGRLPEDIGAHTWQPNVLS